MPSRPAQLRSASPWPLPLIAFVVCTFAALLVFVLPFAVPPPFVATVSASYVAGFNNRVAAFAAAAVGGLVLIWSWWRSKEAPIEQDEAQIGTSLIAKVIGATCLLTACAGWLVAQSHLRYIADSGYILEQLAAHGDYGRALYTQLEFAYGPLLFYPAVAVHAVLRCSWSAAYFITLALNQSVGLLMLAYSMNSLPMRARDRRIAFVLLSIGALTPLLGFNYTFFRFLTPLATLLFATRTTSLMRTVLLLAAGEMLQLGISPEMGSIFLFATLVLAGLATWRRGVRWLLVAAAPLVGVAIFLRLAGPAYLNMLKSVAQGALNLPVAPYPHILIFLFALVWLVPLALGPMLRAEGPDGIRIVSCYVLSVALLPAAFGRCDPLHVFFNGAGILILSVVGVRHLSPRLRYGWLTALLALVVWEHSVSEHLYRPRDWGTVRIVFLHNYHIPDVEFRLDIAALEREVGSAPVATPLEVSLPVEEALKQSGHYRSDYYAFFVDVMDPVAEARKIAELNQSEWALIPADPDYPFLETPSNIHDVQLFAFPYPERHPLPYDVGSNFFDNLTDNWTEVRTFGPYTLYRHKRPVAPK